MATHSSILAWRIPGTAEPSGLPSMGSHRVRHDWSNLAAAASIYWFPSHPWCWFGHVCTLKILVSVIWGKTWNELAQLGLQSGTCHHHEKNIYQVAADQGWEMQRANQMHSLQPNQDQLKPGQPTDAWEIDAYCHIQLRGYGCYTVLHGQQLTFPSLQIFFSVLIFQSRPIPAPTELF